MRVVRSSQAILPTLGVLLPLTVLTALHLSSPPPCTAAGVWPTGGWQTAPPESMGMDSTQLAQARDYAVSHGGGAGFITRGGKLIMSWGSPTQRFDVKSTTKSIGATILGLAIKDGLVSLGDRAIDRYPGFGLPPAENGATGWVDNITLQQLATHSAGFDRSGGFINIIYEPGTMWAYSDGGANWLADVLTFVYGQDLQNVLFGRVLDALGVTSADLVWGQHQYRYEPIEGITRREFGSGIEASADALARIGYLYLREGWWDGAELLPQSFVSAARAPDPSIATLPAADPATYPGAPRHYGLLWWNNADRALPGVPADAYWSWGLGEELIVVIPSLDIVVSRVGDAWQPVWSTNYSALEPFLGPITRSVQTIVSTPPTESAPSAIRLGPVAPSPFRHSTDIRYTVSRPGPVSVAIFDVMGRKVRQWNWDDHAAGDAILHWDGLGQGGQRAPGGVYFIDLRANGERKTAKAVLLD